MLVFFDDPMEENESREDKKLNGQKRKCIFGCIEV